MESAVLLLSFAPTPKVDERRASTGPSKTSYSSAGGSTCSNGFVDVLIGADKKPWGRGYKCEHVSNGTATGGTSPVPPCFGASGETPGLGLFILRLF